MNSVVSTTTWRLTPASASDLAFLVRMREETSIFASLCDMFDSQVGPPPPTHNEFQLASYGEKLTSAVRTAMAVASHNSPLKNSVVARDFKPPFAVQSTDNNNLFSPVVGRASIAPTAGIQPTQQQQQQQADGVKYLHQPVSDVVKLIEIMFHRLQELLAYEEAELSVSAAASFGGGAGVTQLLNDLLAAFNSVVRLENVVGALRQRDQLLSDLTQKVSALFLARTTVESLAFLAHALLMEPPHPRSSKLFAPKSTLPTLTISFSFLTNAVQHVTILLQQAQVSADSPTLPSMILNPMLELSALDGSWEQDHLYAINERNGPALTAQGSFLHRKRVIALSCDVLCDLFQSKMCWETIKAWPALQQNVSALVDYVSLCRRDSQSKIASLNDPQTRATYFSVLDLVVEPISRLLTLLLQLRWLPLSRLIIAPQVIDGLLGLMGGNGDVIMNNNHSINKNVCGTLLRPKQMNSCLGLLTEILCELDQQQQHDTFSADLLRQVLNLIESTLKQLIEFDAEVNHPNGVIANGRPSFVSGRQHGSDDPFSLLNPSLLHDLGFVVTLSHKSLVIREYIARFFKPHEIWSPPRPASFAAAAAKKATESFATALLARCALRRCIFGEMESVGGSSAARVAFACTCAVFPSSVAAAPSKVTLQAAREGWCALLGLPLVHCLQFYATFQQPSLSAQQQLVYSNVDATRHSAHPRHRWEDDDMRSMKSPSPVMPSPVTTTAINHINNALTVRGMNIEEDGGHVSPSGIRRNIAVSVVDLNGESGARLTSQNMNAATYHSTTTTEDMSHAVGLSPDIDEKVSSLQRQLHSIQTELLSTKNKLDQRTASAESSYMKLVLLCKAHKILLEKIVAKEKENDEIHATLKQHEREMSSLRATTALKIASVEGQLRKQAESFSQQEQALMNRLQQTTQILEQKKNELAVSNQSVANLEAMLRASEVERATRDARITDLEDRLGKLQNINRMIRSMTETD